MGEAEDRREAFRSYLRELCRARNVSYRALSRAMHKDDAYVHQLVELGRNRALPTPDELRGAATLLDVPLAHLLEKAWGVNLREVTDEVEAMAAQREEGLDLGDLSPSEYDEVKNFLAYVRAKRNFEAQRQANGPGDVANRS